MFSAWISTITFPQLLNEATLRGVTGWAYNELDAGVKWGITGVRLDSPTGFPSSGDPTPDQGQQLGTPAISQRTYNAQDTMTRSWARTPF